MHASKRLPQFVDELNRYRREIVDEIERVLDLVRDASGQLTERGELLRLDQAVLGSPQVLQRLRQFAGAGLHVFKQPRILDRQHGLRCEGLQQFNRALGKFTGLLAPDHKRANDPICTEQWYDQQGAEPGADDDIEDGRGRIVLNIGNLDRHALLCSLANRSLADVHVTILDLGNDPFVHSIGRAKAKFLLGLLKNIDRTGFCIGELGRFGNDGGQDSFEVNARINRLGDFAKCPQFLDRLRKFVGAGLHLLEQPHVLNRDHRLVGEGRH